MAETRSKRRLRPVQTVREQAKSTAARDEKKTSKARPSKIPRAIGKPFRTIVRGLKWLGRHIIPKYLRGAFSSLRQVTWPNRKETRQLTTAVMIFAIVFATIITLIDYGLDKVFKRIFLK